VEGTDPMKPSNPFKEEGAKFRSLMLKDKGRDLTSCLFSYGKSFFILERRCKDVTKNI